MLNPLVMNVSTRGNGDALVGALVLGCLACLRRGRRRGYPRGGRHVELAAVSYGLAVHLRVYPAIYALALFLWLGRGETSEETVWTHLCRRPFARRTRGGTSTPQVRFVAWSVGTFAACGLAGYAAYGDAFLENTYLYHLRRADNRHNFSAYFYDIYLRAGGSSSILAWIPQLTTLVGLSVQLYDRDLRLCVTCLTMAFVAFNKVCTAQYFLWYVTLLPLCVSRTRLALRGRGGVLLLAWFLTETHWLYWGYQLEFEGRSVFTELWLAGILFFLVNVWIIVELIRHHRLDDEDVESASVCTTRVKAM